MQTKKEQSSGSTAAVKKTKKKRGTRSKSVENRIEVGRKLQEYLKDFELLQKKDAYSVTAFNRSFLAAKEASDTKKKNQVRKTLKVLERREAYNNKEEGIMRRCTYISNYLEGKVEMDPRYLFLLKDVIRQMRNSRKKLQKELEENPNTEDRVVIDITKHTSTFGYRLEGLFHILQLLEEIGEAYDPSNVLIQIKKLKLFYVKLEALNREVARTGKAYNQARITCTKNSRDMIKVARKIRKLVRGTYGANSPEFELVDALNLD